MARLPRYIIPGQPQHIIQRGNNRQAIFASDEDFVFFRDALVEAAGRFGLEVHAYVWMTNHIHLLATPGREDSIGKTLQSVGRRYVAYFNARQQRTGTLWEGRYRATVVDTSRYFIALMRYIEQNPVRAGMVAVAGDYTWSSHRRYAMGVQDANTAWLVPHAEWAALGLSSYARQESYRALFAAQSDAQELEQIRQSTHKGWALGDAAFAQWVEQQTDRPAASKGIGRPRSLGSVETKEIMKSDPIKKRK
jgi:putative transposase